MHQLRKRDPLVFSLYLSLSLVVSHQCLCAWLNLAEMCLATYSASCYLCSTVRLWCPSIGSKVLLARCLALWPIKHITIVVLHDLASVVHKHRK